MIFHRNPSWAHSTWKVSPCVAPRTSVREKIQIPTIMNKFNDELSPGSRKLLLLLQA
jgi:hypothetical protein